MKSKTAAKPAKAPKAKVAKLGSVAKAVQKPRSAARATKPKASLKPAILKLVLASLDTDQASDAVTIDLRGRNPMADFMVVATGRSQRNVGAIAENLARRLKDEGYATRIEGLSQGDWVLIDAIDVVVHIFRAEVRAHYDIERMWGTTGREDSEAA